MFDVSWAEMLVIAIVLIVVVGPKDLPRMLRTFGRTTSKLRVMAGDFRRQFDDALKDAELDDIKKLADDARNLHPARAVRKAFDPVEKAARDVKAGLDSAMSPKEPDRKPDAAPAQPVPKPAAAAANGADAAAVPVPAGPARAPAKRAAKTGGGRSGQTKAARAKAGASEADADGPKAAGKAAPRARTAASRKKTATDGNGT